jgi:cytochrome c556
LLDRLEDVQKKNQLAALTREGQVNELYRRRAQLARWIADNAGRLADTARLQAEIDLETMKGEEERLQRELDKPAREHHPNLPDVNALQRIGAWAAAPGFEAMALSVHKQNEKHLAAMKTDLHTLAHGAGGFHQVHF